MRLLTSILFLLCGTAAAADTWRWVDKDGVVHFSDQPSPGAERLELKSAPRSGSVVPPPSTPRPVTGPATPFSYSTCAFSSPSGDQVFNAVTQVSASLNILPALQPGHRIAVQLNGRPVTGWSPGSQNTLLQNLNRGSYSLNATIFDAQGKPVCNSGTLTFHIRQPSLLSPGAQSARQRSGAAAPAPKP
jgi:hypothetical protein